MITTNELDKRGIVWRQSYWSWTRPDVRLETSAFTDNGSYEKMYFNDYAREQAKMLTEEGGNPFIVAQKKVNDLPVLTVVEITYGAEKL